MEWNQIQKETQKKLSRTERRRETNILRDNPRRIQEGIYKMVRNDSHIPPRRHLGLYNALIGIEEISAFFATMYELPVLHGFAPERWANALK